MLFDKIQELCEEKGINPSRLENELGLGRGTLYTWRKSSPSVDKLKKVANYFHVSTDYLLGLSENQNLIYPDDFSELSDVYLSLAKEAQKNSIDPDDILMAIKMIKEIRQSENKK